MKIVHVEDFVHPNAGYQVNMLARLQVQQGHTVDIVTGELEKVPCLLKDFFGSNNILSLDDLFRLQAGARIHRVPLLAYYSGRAIFQPFKLFKVVRQIKPDVVFVHSEDTVTGILFILLSRWLKYPIVLDCHMVEMASLNPFRNIFRMFYRAFITPIIINRNIPLIRVVDSDYVEKNFAIPLTYTKLLPLGTDTDLFKPHIENMHRVRKDLDLASDAFLVIYAGKLDEDKGGKFFSEAILKKLETSAGRSIEFLIIGNSVGPYSRSVECNFKSSENLIRRLPTQPYLELAQYYQAADLAVFPRQCSMSFFQVQACGIPVLFEENEINIKRVGDGNAFTFKAGKIGSFRDKLVFLASQTKADYSKFSQNARDYALDGYDFVEIAKGYTDVLSAAVDNWDLRHGTKSIHS